MISFTSWKIPINKLSLKILENNKEEKRKIIFLRNRRRRRGETRKRIF